MLSKKKSQDLPVNQECFSSGPDTCGILRECEKKDLNQRYSAGEKWEDFNVTSSEFPCYFLE